MDFYKGKVSSLTTSKIYQVNHYDAYVIGGSKYDPSLLTYEFDVEHSCILVNIHTGNIKLMEAMTVGR